MVGGDLRSDGEWTEAFHQCREEPAFEALVRRHGARVFRICRAILGNREDAQDAAQAVFVVLARSSGTLRHRSHIGPWLHRVATHVALDACQRRTAQRERDRKAGAIRQTTGSQAGNERMEQAAMLHEELEHLPEKHRQALVLFYLQGCSLVSVRGFSYCLERPFFTVSAAVVASRQSSGLSILFP